MSGLPPKYNGVFPKDKHGTITGFSYGCRCARCNTANQDYYLEKNLQRATMWDMFIRPFKSGPCVDCGLLDPDVMTFDHIVPLNKEFQFSRSCLNKPVEEVMREIGKCELRCHNCHHRRTVAQLRTGEVRPGMQLARGKKFR